MLKYLLPLLVGTLLFSEYKNIEIIEKHRLKIVSCLTEEDISKSDEFIKRDIDKTFNTLANNPNLDNATEADIWKFFLSNKTNKFIAKYKQLHPTYY